jgi:hypothetical protein
LIVRLSFLKNPFARQITTAMLRQLWRRDVYRNLSEVIELDAIDAPLIYGRDIEPMPDRSICGDKCTVIAETHGVCATGPQRPTPIE